MEPHNDYLIVHGWPNQSVASRWRACLADCDLATHYTAPEYFLEPTILPQRPFAILSTAGDDVTGVLTAIRIGDRVQSGLSVRPQIAISRRADPLRTMRHLIAGLRAAAEGARLIDLFVWADLATLVAAPLRQRQCEGVVMLDLSRTADELFRRFSDNKRTNIKKAIKLGVSVDSAVAADDVSAYYAVYADWARRKQLPVLEEDQVHAMVRLENNRRLFVARHQGRVVAGIIVRFLRGGVVEFAANSSLADALQLRPNDLLHWHAIQWAIAEGMTKYSLGGAHLFLRKFGGEIVTTVRCRQDLSAFRTYAIADWFAERAGQVRQIVPETVVTLGRSFRHRSPLFRAGNDSGH